MLAAVRGGAYASDSLLERCSNLSSRDAGLASQIVFGCLRYQGQLDFLIKHYSGRDAGALHEPVLLALRSAIFQLRYLERIPPHAAVHETVEYVKRTKRAASGLVNAVLRKVNREAVPWPDRETELSCPESLLQGWSAHFGAETAERIARNALTEPERYIRVPPNGAPPSHTEPTEVVGCFRVLGPLADATRLQDIGSQSVVPLLDLAPGQSYLDLCAAPGNKTLQALETPLALAIACDVSERRIAEVPAVCHRVVLDATGPLPFSREFDRIFIDSPCSGTGTLGRNPEIKWRVHRGDFQRFQEKQIRIARQAAKVLAPGGKLVYATCSLETEENEDVVKAVTGAQTGLHLQTEEWRLPGRDQGDGFYAAVLVRKL